MVVSFFVLIYFCLQRFQFGFELLISIICASATTFFVNDEVPKSDCTSLNEFFSAKLLVLGTNHCGRVSISLYFSAKLSVLVLKSFYIPFKIIKYDKKLGLDLLNS